MDGDGSAGRGPGTTILELAASLYTRKETQPLFVFTCALAAFMLVQGMYGAYIDSLGASRARVSGCLGGQRPQMCADHGPPTIDRELCGLRCTHTAADIECSRCTKRG